MFYIAILAATAASFVFGYVWYRPLFGKFLVKAKSGGTAKEQSRKRMIAVGVANFVLVLLLVLGLVNLAPLFSIWSALLAGGVLWMMFVFPTTTIHWMYSRMSWKVLLIDLGYWLGVFLISPAILFLIEG